MLLTAEKGIRPGICHYIFQHSKANNKHLKDYDKKIVIYSTLGCE